MNRIRHFARVSVSRTCLLLVLAGVPFLIGLSQEPVLDLRLAAIMASLLWAFLGVKAWLAPRTDYRRHSVWPLLDRWHGLPESHAHGVISWALRRAFLFHADLAASCAAALWVVYFATASVA